MLLTDDENFFSSMEALAHVYLQAFAKMQLPCKQIKLEADALDGLWNTLQAGVGRISSDADFNFLSNDQMLEYGLDSTFKERIDMATFARGVMVPQPNLASIQHSLRDFEVILLQHPKDLEDEDEPGLLIETFLYLITLTLTLAAKKKFRSKMKITASNIQPFCNTRTIPAIGALKGVNFAPLIKLAANLVNDNLLFSAMHNDTLKNIATIIQHRLDGLGPPRDAESYKVVSEDYQEDIGELYVGEAWKLLSQKVDARKWFKGDILKASYIRPARPDKEHGEEEEVMTEAKKENVKGRKESYKVDRTVLHREGHENDHGDKQKESENHADQTSTSVMKHTAKGKGKKVAITTPAGDVEEHTNTNDSSDVIATPGLKETTIIQKNKESAKKSTKEGASNEQPEVLRSPSRSTRSRTAKTTYRLVPQRFGSEEFEGGDELPPPPPSKKRRIISDEEKEYVTDPEDENSSHSSHQHKVKSTTNKTCDTCGCHCGGSSNKHGKPGGSRKEALPVSDTEAGPTSAAKGRKKNRPWTSEEVLRLKALVSMPRFRHKPDAQQNAKRRRNIKWSHLKRYDEDNGNILRHRSQVQLKDKHRDMTDEGEHYRQVKEINKKRQEPQMRFPLDTSRRL